jgi:LacI family transcriptional regulator
VQKIRLKDVAARAGVAVNTASTILNRRPNSWASKETEERVFKAASDLGYKPNRAAQALRFGKFHAIALVIADLHNPYYTAFADAMEEAAGEHGYDVLIETWRNDLARELDTLDKLENRNVDGVAAFLSNPVEHREYLGAQAATGTPYVVLSTTGEPPLPVDAVLADFEGGLRDAVDTLVQLGHRRFAFICALAKGQYAGQRPELFSRLLGEKGIAEGTFDIVSCSHTMASACAAAAGLFSRPPSERPTAVIGLNDVSAIGAMRAAAESGLQIPRDVSVVGVDDIPLASFLPVTLSTIAQPIPAMARRAVEMLLSRIERKADANPAEQVVFPTSFIRRESVGAANLLP